MILVYSRVQGARHPRRHGRFVTEAVERGHQPGKARPSKAGKMTVLEPADDSLVDTAEALELTLRQPHALASAKHQLPDQPEPTPGLLIGAAQPERLSSHRVTMTFRPYRAISRTRVRTRLSAVMQVECIATRLPGRGRPSPGTEPASLGTEHPGSPGTEEPAWPASAHATVSPRRGMRRRGSSRTAMHSTCIWERGSSVLGKGPGGGHRGPGGGRQAPGPGPRARGTRGEPATRAT